VHQGGEQGPGPNKSEDFVSRQGDSSREADVDELLARLKDGLRSSKPGEESVAAALQAIQRLALEADIEESFNAESGAEEGSGPTCPSCGKPNRPGHRFCAHCGVPIPALASDITELSPLTRNAPSGQVGHHYYHHHYHHHYFSPSDGMASAAAFDARIPVDSTAARETPRFRAPLGGAAVSRAEAAVRKTTQDWAQACNTKQLDDLVELYTADAMVLRPNVPAVRGTAAIREFFFGVLEAGLGEVELETLRVEIFGEIAYEAGKCKSLVPIAMGKRREERGKYLLVLNRQAGSEWKIAADSWSNDLSLATPEPIAKPGTAGPGTQAQRMPRKP
jgi:ketosteroid isomerase-like protein